MADLMDEAIEISHKLIPCNICGRTFLPSPLKKHAKVCEKNATRKRKTFNSLKQRIEGTELAVFHQKSFLRKNNDNVTTTHAPQQPQQQQQQQLQQQQQQQTQQQQQQQEEKRNQSKWKEKHEELVQAIRAAKGEKTMAPRRSISAVGSMGTTEQCPSCDRHFGPKAYDRHVEWCKEHKIRASKSPAIVTIAKERLEARTKYRVPPLTKSKRTATRDKYASPSGRCSQDGGGGGGGGGGSTGNLLNVRSTSNLEQRHTSSKKTKQKNSVPPAEPIIKHNAEKLKSSNFKYRVYPILKMNDTNINESVLDMTVSQMNLRMQSPNRPSPPQSQYKLITWKETPQPPQQQQQSHNKQQHPPPPPQQQQVEQNVSTTTCLPFTINLVDSEQNVQNHNDMNMNIIEYETNSDGDDDLNEDDTNLLSVLPTIVEETESAQLLTIKEAISSSQMRDTDDDNDNDNNDNVNVNVENDIDEVCRPEPPEQPETESIEEFRSSTPVNRTDDPSIKIRNETVHSISFDISPVLKAPNDDDDIDDGIDDGIDDDDEPQIQNNTGEISEQEWQDLDDYYQDIKAKRKKRKHTKMLDKFLKDKSTTNCRLEVEIVANEPCDKRNKHDANNEKRQERNLNLYRVNSSEIVIRGERCIDALNKSFSRNKIKHVNIVFLNEETKRESEICLQTDDNDNDNDNDDNDNEYDDDDIYERRKKTCGARKLMKRERERGRERERTRDREREREGDNFWAQYTNNKINNNNDNNKNNNKNKIKNKNNRDCSFNDDCDTTVMDLDDEDEVEDYYVVDDNVDDDEDDDDDDDLILPPINVKQRSSKLAKGDETFETFNKQRLRRERESPPSPPVGVRFPPIHEEKYQSREKEEYDPFIIAEKQLMELLEGDDFKPYKTPSPKNKIQLKSLPTTTTTTTTTTLPIFEDDNFEFLENFINDNYTTQAKHQRKFSDEINSIDPKLINANDNLKLPEPGQLAPDTDHYYSDVDHYSAQYDKSISILEPLILPKTEMKRSHSSQLTDFDEFISSAIDDDDDGLPTLKTYLAHDLTKQKKCSTVSSFGKGRNEHNAANKKHPLSPLKRNVTMPGGVLANPVVKARSMKNKQDIQDYLHVRHDQKLAAAVAPSRDKLKALSPRPQSSDDLFPIGHDMYNEYKKYEDMYRREQHDNMHDHENEDDEVSSNEEQHLVQQHKQKINADSAYNRKSPKQQQIAPKSRQKVPPPPPQPQLKRSPSSSGSEAANNNQNNQNTQNNQNQNKNNRLTKFCHECGTKYPLDSAKFCVECGIKRLVL